MASPNQCFKADFGPNLKPAEKLASKNGEGNKPCSEIPFIVVKAIPSSGDAWRQDTVTYNNRSDERAQAKKTTSGDSVNLELRVWKNTGP